MDIFFNRGIISLRTGEPFFSIINALQVEKSAFVEVIHHILDMIPSCGGIDEID